MTSKVFSIFQSLCYSLAFFSLFSCDRIQGDVHVYEPLTLNSHRGEITISPGDYKAQVQQRRRSLRLRLDSPHYRKPYRIDFKIPRNQNLPQGDGEFFIDAQQSGQLFDLAGLVSSEYEDSDEFEQKERCVITAPRRICRATPRGTHCRIFYQTVPGRREVTVFTRHHRSQYHIDLIKPSSQESYGQFISEHQWTQTIRRGQTRCQPYWMGF